MFDVHQYSTVHVVTHPLVQHKLTLMRDKNTTTREFRDLLKEIALFMGYELTRDYPLTTATIQTPICTTEAPILRGKKPVILPVLRAGLGMTDGLLTLMPGARIGHIGLYRAEDKRPVEYFVRLPELRGRTCIVVDPMIATGYSAVHAVDVLKKRGVAGRDIQFMALLGAPEGIEIFTQHHPDVHVWIASIDKGLNEDAYIVPGLGDAGDRIFGTK